MFASSAPYQNRAARLNLSFPVEFQTQGSSVPGHCLNLSETGLLAAFQQELDLWSRGSLLLPYGQSQCLVPARVARAAEFEAGLVFCFQNEAQRKAVMMMLQVAAKNTHLVGPPPF